MVRRLPIFLLMGTIGLLALFLSDGDPNVGTIVDRATIVQRIMQQNAAPRISINTIGIDARDASEEFLKQLAADNFGEFRSSR